MILLLCIFISFIGISTQENIKVTVYYESLCPGSKQFITEQLYPSYQQLGSDALTVELVPYVSVIKKNSGKWSLQCQHGEKECYASQIQACVFSLNTTQDQLMEFIQCHMTLDAPGSRIDIKKCLRKNKLEWTDVKNCLNGDVNSYLLDYHNQILNLEPPLEYFPHILFNNISDDDIETVSRENFIEVVCAMFTKDKPAACVTE